MIATIWTSCQLANKMNINRFLLWWQHYVADDVNATADKENESKNDGTPQDDTPVV
jgi:hypothetical protein